MPKDISKDIEEKFGVQARKLNLSEFPPELTWFLHLMGLETYDLYAIDASNLDSTNSNKN